MRLKFSLKKKSAYFSQEQLIFLEHYIDDPSNWKGLKQDFISLALIEVGANHIIVDVEDTGNRWRKHFARNLCLKGKLDDLCVPYGKSSRELFEVQTL
ncbi:hypothetical protein MJA45_18515 [Paenibacillus aurantius]|uniref:Uncharacterized protein n=1 Tax=Paenibacillus aurantius TaxID=2918900 RepID=A0AA96LCJ8_9BACL|nr:hypothetical protein [Paenibacillus aurantius]WNQ09616.1 hypothetical protein MJA45_18515 [Paenibacillus aurantius]